MAGALSPYQDEAVDGWYRNLAHIETAKHKTRREEGEGGRRKRTVGGGKRAAEVATSPRKSRVMPTRNCTTPRTPLPTSLCLPRSIRSIPFSFPSPPPRSLSVFRSVAFSSFPTPPLPFYRHPLSLPSFLLSLATYDAAIPFVGPPPPPPPPSTASASHLSLGNNPLTFRVIWSGNGE